LATILIVDDDCDLLPVLGEFLRSVGHTVRLAENGEEGLSALAYARPDVLLLDVDMPRLTGPETAMRILIQDVGMETIPIVLLSGMADLAKTAARVGTPYFSTKPTHPEALVELVDRALRERRPPRPPVAASPGAAATPAEATQRCGVGGGRANRTIPALRGGWRRSQLDGYGSRFPPRATGERSPC